MCNEGTGGRRGGVYLRVRMLLQEEGRGLGCEDIYLTSLPFTSRSIHCNPSASGFRPTKLLMLFLFRRKKYAVETIIVVLLYLSLEKYFPSPGMMAEELSGFSKTSLMCG